MADIINVLLDILVNATAFQRLAALWAWCLGGILLAVQTSQLGEENPIKWTKLTSQTKPYWYLLYVSEVLFLITGSYALVLEKMDGMLWGREQQLLNGIWLSVVGVEIVMVLGAAAIFVFRTVQPGPKQKTQ